jgi:hypothetical protein
MDDQILRQRLTSGDLVDLRTGDPVVDRPANADRWGSVRDVAADLLVDLLTTREDPATARRRVQLAGARITGTVDLGSAILSRSLLLTACYLTEPIVLKDADVLALGLADCQVNGIDATAMRCRGDVDLSGTFSAENEINLFGAHIGGVLNCDGATFRNPGGYALSAPLLTVDQSMFCRAGFTAEGQVHLRGAHIGGSLNCGAATFRNPGGEALSADRLTVGQSMFCHEGFVAEGEVRIAGAHIGGQLDCSGGTFRNPGGCALDADGLTVGQAMVCSDGFIAEGEVRLRSGHIEESFDCDGATMRNAGGYALRASRLTVGHGMFCGEGFVAEGEIRLPGAHIGGQLNCDSATFRNRSGYALYASRLTVDHDVSCREGFTAEGEVHLAGAYIGGGLDCEGATLCNPDKVALNLTRATIPHDVLMRPKTLAGTLDLTAAKVGAWHDAEASWPQAIRLRGFTYDAIDADPEISAKTRLRWLRLDRDGYQPQPYEQLANTWRQLGHDAAPTVLIAKQWRRRSSDPSWWRRWLNMAWSFLLRVTIGYGYRPWYVLAPAAILYASGWRLFDRDRKHGFIVSAGDNPPGTVFNAGRYTADLLLPVANLGERGRFAAIGPAAWHAFTFTLSGWLLALALVAGLSGVFKRD